MALPTKLVRIWPTRMASPSKASGVFCAICQSSCKPLVWASTRLGANVLSSNWDSKNGELSNVKRCASIFEMSNKSLMMPIRDLAEPCANSKKLR